MAVAAPKRQARKAVRKVLDLRAKRESRGIRSVRTADAYQQALTQAAEWMQAHGDTRHVKDMDTQTARIFLSERAQHVSQKTLDRDRQAISWCTRADPSSLSRKDFQASHPTTRLAQEQRAYTRAEIERITTRQPDHHALATRVAHDAGLRAHELASLKPASESSIPDRQWRSDVFAGREGHSDYAVVGKGGLERPVKLSPELARELEQYRRDAPTFVKDRGVSYESYYGIGYGNAWSKDFTQASKAELGYSSGAHGVRHTYAQERLNALQYNGYDYKDAKEIDSQEIGHFRSSITDTYLR